VPGARWRLSVALLLPAGPAGEVDVLRRALGSTTLDRVPPHLTLVPPVNVKAEDLPAALAVLRSGAADAEPLELVLGPVASFEPVTPTIHLALGGDVERLRRLHRTLLRGPLERSLQHAFVAHVSLVERAPLHRVRAARAALADYRVTAPVGRVTALAEVRGPDGRRGWRPVADVDLGGVRVVGRGGLPVELASGTLVDPEALDVLRGAGVALAALPPPSPAGPVVLGRVEGRVAGAVWGPGPAQRWAGPELHADLLTAEWYGRHHEPVGSDDPDDPAGELSR
jgi:hypothetical protein